MTKRSRFGGAPSVLSAFASAPTHADAELGDRFGILITEINEE
ncbi:hypothetical protein [Streptomyces sp. AP-93]|nr:hypothetical protein [Streptomyces sp. AP-93]